MDENWKVAYLGVGSNLGKSKQLVHHAIERVDRHNACQISKLSSLYRSVPIGDENQPDFVNAVCKLNTLLTPHQLLELVLTIETDLGRVRTGQLNGPRLIDLDLLLYEHETVDSSQLTLPHPRLHERRFVLQPLLEIEPSIIIPNRGRGIELLAACDAQWVVKINSLNNNYEVDHSEGENAL